MHRLAAMKVGLTQEHMLHVLSCLIAYAGLTRDHMPQVGIRISTSIKHDYGRTYSK